MATTSYQLFSWGRQREGQGGRPEQTQAQTWPKEVEDFPPKIRLIAAAVDRSAVVSEDNLIWSFGQGFMGELGLAYKTQQSYPEPISHVAKDLKWKAVACGGEHTLALTDNGELWSWGANELGQLGQGHTKMVDRPAKVLTSQKWTMIAAGLSHSIALSEYGEIYTWGGNWAGQLGIPRPEDFTVPCMVQKEGLPTFKFVTAGDACSAAITTAGDVFVWGSGGQGRLGLGNTLSFTVPEQVKELTQISQISISSNHGLALSDRLDLYAWGAAHNGELGYGEKRRQLKPVLIPTKERFTHVRAGHEYSLAISERGSLWGWGNCANGVLGNGRKVGNLWVPTLIFTGNVIWRNLVTHRTHVLALGQGQAAAPEGWSTESENIDPDAKKKTKPEEPEEEPEAGDATPAEGNATPVEDDDQ